MSSMTFTEWVRTHWLREGEAPTTGLMRMSGEWGVSYKTLFYAWKGCRVRPEIASVIERETGGIVNAAVLVMLPARGAIDEAAEPDAA